MSLVFAGLAITAVLHSAAGLSIWLGLTLVAAASFLCTGTAAWIVVRASTKKQQSAKQAVQVVSRDAAWLVERTAETVA